MNVTNKVMVLANSHQRYHDFLLSRNIPPSQCVFIDSPHRLLGREGVLIIMKDWQNNKTSEDICAIHDVIDSRRHAILATFLGEAR